MSIESMAGSVGKELLKSATRKEGTIRKLGESLGKKLLEKFSDKLSSNKNFQQHLQRLLDKHDASTPTNAGTTPARHHLHRPWGDALDSSPGIQFGRINTEKALSAFQSFDTDANGEISQDELSQGIADLDTQLANLHDRDHSGASTESRTQRADMNKMRNMAQSALNNYQIIAGLDGNTKGLTSEDLMALAGQDTHTDSISLRDWRSVLTGKKV